jgi:phosphoribosylamine-glycine ligase
MDKKKFLFASLSGLISDIAWQVSKEGHEVRYYIKDQKERDVAVFKKPPADEIHIEDVKQVNGQWLVTGTSGVILIVVGLGQTMKQAQAQVYSRIKNVLSPNMYYRTDIGDRWDEDSDRLHNWGILR